MGPESPARRLQFPSLALLQHDGGHDFLLPTPWVPRVNLEQMREPGRSGQGTSPSAVMPLVSKLSRRSW